MGDVKFVQQNKNWNAEPNAPDLKVRTEGRSVELRFYLNPWAYDAEQEEVGILTFEDVRAWRLGATNDEGWYMKQCRYSRVAPNWGEFYEIEGDDPLAWSAEDWQKTPIAGEGNRHFLFYMRDETFECFAREWSLSREAPPSVDW